MSRGPTLVVAVSARMLAELAVGAGHEVLAVDGFGDLDLRRLCPVRTPEPGGGEPGALAPLAALACDVPAASLVYGAGFENRPDLVAAMAQGRELLGNAPDVLRAVRDPAQLGACLREAGLSRPRTVAAADVGPRGPGAGRWLRKPVRGGAGHGVRGWRGGRLSGDVVLQRHVRGLDCSIAALGDGRSAMVLGVTEQLIGRQAFGVRGYRWCGNVSPPGLPAGERRALLEQARAICACLTEGFGLRGLFGVDVIWDGRRAWVLEVNPRPGASLEVLERQAGVRVFDAHLEALNGRLAQVDVEHGWGAAAQGKAIVFATHHGIARRTEGWPRRGIRDVPSPGDEIHAGHPLCTLLAEGDTPQNVVAALERRTAELRDEISGWVVTHA